MSSAIRRGAASAAVLAAVLGGAAAPASAHDQLVSSDPRDGQNIPPTHRDFVLTYSDKIQTFGSEIVVEDGSGKRTTVDAKISRDQVRVHMPKDLPPGQGSIRWRVVSSDGHPVDGIISFNVVEPGKSPSASAAPSSGAAKAKTETQPYKDTPSVNWPLFVIGTTAVAAGIFGSIIGYRLRKKKD